MSEKIKLNKQDFKNFIKGLSRVSDTSILNIKEDSIYAISSSEDRSLYLWSTLKGTFDVEQTLNVPSLKKLMKCLDLIDSNDFDFVINSNNLEFINKTIKFKYHLYNDGILVAPKLTLSKVESMQYDFEFEVEKEFLDFILKNSVVFKETNKLYIYTDDGKLVWSLADKTMMNTDTLTVIGEEVDFELEDFILNLNNLRLISPAESYLFKINKMGIGNIYLKNGKTELNYIISSLSK